MIRPLFQALRLEVTAGSWTLGMICPPILLPNPVVITALTPKAQHWIEWPLLDACADGISKTASHRNKPHLILSPFIFAAICLNDHFSCCEAVWKFTLLQHYPCCERAQREKAMTESGSSGTFAAPSSIGCLG
uniref:hypothetical protein n=1 Tax=Sulfitobacter mediterraneus TaxID=83219 RepID=UPI0018CC28C5|nr:hypothetical protein [Sulfitobacter mediterraneus]